MFITRKHLSRRAVLRGAGATLALPLLDCMVPALTALSRTAAAPARLRRIAGCLIRCRRLIFRLAVGAAFDLIEQPQLLAFGVAELLGAAPVQLVLEPGELFFVQLQLPGQILQLRVQLTVLLGQLVLFQLQTAILLAHRIELSRGWRCAGHVYTMT